MNNIRRKHLKRSLSLLEQAGNIIETGIEEEQDSMDNIPENLQNSEHYEKMETTIEKLEEVVQLIGEIKDAIEEAIE